MANMRSMADWSWVRQKCLNAARRRSLISMPSLAASIEGTWAIGVWSTSKSISVADCQRSIHSEFFASFWPG